MRIAQQDKNVLRLLTCGSEGVGKSTLVGRLLHEAKRIADDELAALEQESARLSAEGDAINPPGLAIDIDVTYRYFSTGKRTFIVADTPGHEQYTRNMATGASTAGLAVILIDAHKGVLAQTLRHTRVAAMMGVRHLVLAINKMDLIEFNQPLFERIDSRYREYCAGLGFASIQTIPLSALNGDNVASPSARIHWYRGPTLIDYLNNVETTNGDTHRPLRMPVQSVNRADQNNGGIHGSIADGEVRPGDRVRVLPSGVLAQVKEIVAAGGNVPRADAGKSVTLTLTEAVDVMRGDVIAAADAPPEVADQFEARLLWMSAHPLLPGRPYLLTLHNKDVTATVTEIKYREDIASGAHLAAKTLALNDIAMVNLSLSQNVTFEPYAQSRALGGFILVDKLTRETVGMGMIEFALRRAANIHWQALEINRQARAAAKHQTARCIWFTGLSGSGKSTIANVLEKRLHAAGKHTYLLDGDNVRHGLNRDLGFTEADRVENVRRVAEVARLMVDAGLIVLASFISPFSAERKMARDLFAEGEFIEVFVDAPLEICERRDSKGLYAKARRGELKNFTGIDSAYEVPDAPEIHLQAGTTDAEACAAEIVKWLALTKGAPDCGSSQFRSPDEAQRNPGSDSNEKTAANCISFHPATLAVNHQTRALKRGHLPKWKFYDTTNLR
ncbi:MAG: adenylyl-sulfate kinase [Betaproteobacteria bacterium]|nr:adenylyl-sulfate kinase [Betaproteobacteria bacterium]